MGAGRRSRLIRFRLCQAVDHHGLDRDVLELAQDRDLVADQRRERRGGQEGPPGIGDEDVGARPGSTGEETQRQCSELEDAPVKTVTVYRLA